MTDINSLALLITAVSVTFGVIFAALIATRAFRVNDANRANLENLADREFHSNTEGWRLQIEAQLAELNKRLTDTPPEFAAVNHLLVDAQKRGVSLDVAGEINTGEFLRRMGVSSDPHIDSDLVFVLTPFHPRERGTFSAIVEAFQPFPVKVLRGDEEGAEGDVLRHIVSMIVRARIIVANISSRNPNVMYELGIAHALGKPVIMISSTSGEELPFDVKTQRVLFYKTRAHLIMRLREEVARRLFSDTL